eukprot:2014098-Prymnesium_polylepis.1
MRLAALPEQPSHVGAAARAQQLGGGARVAADVLAVCRGAAAHTKNTAHHAPSTAHRAPRIDHRAPRTTHHASRTVRRAPCAARRAPRVRACVWACGRAGVRACGRAGARACGRASVWVRGRVGVWACGRTEGRVIHERLELSHAAAVVRLGEDGGLVRRDHVEKQVLAAHLRWR